MQLKEQETMINQWMDDHQRLADLMKQVDPYLQKLIFVHFLDHGQNLGDIYHAFLNLKSHLVWHMAQEARVFYYDWIDNPIFDASIMLDDHIKLKTSLSQIELLSNHFTMPQDGCETYRYTFGLLKKLHQELTEHMALEEAAMIEDKEEKRS